LLNLATARGLAGDVVGALEAGLLLGRAGNDPLARVGNAYQLIVATSTFGSLEAAEASLVDLDDLLPPGDQHFRGVRALNLSHAQVATGRLNTALDSATEAVALLSSTSAGVELVAAHLARAMALAFSGAIDLARAEARVASQRAAPGQMLEVASEIAHLEALLGESTFAWPLLERVAKQIDPSTDQGEQALLSRAILRGRDTDLAGAIADVGLFRFGEPRTTIAFEARRHLITGFVLALAGMADATIHVDRGIEIAAAQGAHLWAQFGAALKAFADEGADASRAVRQASLDGLPVLSLLAELVVRRLPELDDDAKALVSNEAAARPWRWREPVRQVLRSSSAETRLAGAQILEVIGLSDDIGRLREVAKSLRGRGSTGLGLGLARRLAHRVLIEDLGRVSIAIGDSSAEGAGIRRKVLALLCLLLTRPKFSSTREEVSDALWPDLDPSSALNSLNQTVYFLRRVFEPKYREDVSPGYVGQDGETIWLDTELVDSRSRRCLSIIRGMPGQPNPEECVALASEYRGRFALDFAYEEWSTAFRDSLHAAYLRVMERAIRSDLATGHFERGIFLAERAAEVDPDADDIQRALIRLYRLSGAHAAAGEQYGNYTRAMRELGEEPTAFADV
jgi:DNA-binding SARP family transcriptional activator